MKKVVSLADLKDDSTAVKRASKKAVRKEIRMVVW
jgi:hypothetical protein